MILRPYRRAREAETECAILRRLLDDERGQELRDALAAVKTLALHVQQMREEMDSYDRSLRLLAEGQRKLGVGG